jgi:hypothetical protein
MDHDRELIDKLHTMALIRLFETELGPNFGLPFLSKCINRQENLLI